MSSAGTTGDKKGFWSRLGKKLSSFGSSISELWNRFSSYVRNLWNGSNENAEGNDNDTSKPKSPSESKGVSKQHESESSELTPEKRLNLIAEYLYNRNPRFKSHDKANVISLLKEAMNSVYKDNTLIPEVLNIQDLDKFSTVPSRIIIWDCTNIGSHYGCNINIPTTRKQEIKSPEAETGSNPSEPTKQPQLESRRLTLEEETSLDFIAKHVHEQMFKERKGHPGGSIDAYLKDNKRNFFTIEEIKQQLKQFYLSRGESTIPEICSEEELNEFNQYRLDLLFNGLNTCVKFPTTKKPKIDSPLPSAESHPSEPTKQPEHALTVEEQERKTREELKALKEERKMLLREMRSERNIRMPFKVGTSQQQPKDAQPQPAPMNLETEEQKQKAIKATVDDLLSGVEERMVDGQFPGSSLSSPASTPSSSRRNSIGS